VENRKKFLYLPSTEPQSDPAPATTVVADTPCPCCGCITIPNGGDALAFICPVCLWEIDSFITGANEPSDQNHGLTLNQCRENYRACGAVLPRLVQYARKPLPQELPET